jgi:hypothetical protein
MSSLPTTLRRQLETAIKYARKIADGGARKALEVLAVHEPDPYRFMDDGQLDLRRKLRAQAKQLGDGESLAKPGAYEIKHLVEKLAYDQWHRLLFARYLLENNLLISPEHGVSVSLDDCEELAPSLGLKDAWSVAARFAAKELPEIFRADDPAGEVELAVEDRSPLIQLVIGLPIEVFTASDSLGWCYQFWQAERKREVNDSGDKIGADELPAVTQLFTEDYMVDFLLDNTLGAWHSGRVFAAKPGLAEAAESEEELRMELALPGCPWKYLRFIKADGGEWTPAAGTFEGWPKTPKELTCLDPCMGSGHFVVAMFERLVALRVTEEGLDELAAVEAVIRDNLFGLEIDPRCTQIAAFNLALVAWRFAGHCTLPPMNLACSGLAPNTKREDWLKLAAGNSALRFPMGALYDLFQKAPSLGSLIDPRLDKAVNYSTKLEDLQPLLDKALLNEVEDDAIHEMAVAARGIAKAAEILGQRFTLVATNVPYLGRGNQHDLLKDYCDRVHPLAKADLATCFVERSFDFCLSGGSVALVTPQNWLFLQSYMAFRQALLDDRSFDFMGRLGPGAFETISGEVVKAILVCLTKSVPSDRHFSAIDAMSKATPSQKRQALTSDAVIVLSQARQRANPDSIITVEELANTGLLTEVASVSVGSQPGQTARLTRYFWELRDVRSKEWTFMESSPTGAAPYTGKNKLCVSLAEMERARITESVIRGKQSWGRPGVVVAKMSGLSSALYCGCFFDDNIFAIVPRKEEDLAAIWSFVRSGEFGKSCRKLNQKLNVTVTVMSQVPFNLPYWRSVAAEMFPKGLPSPESTGPAEWLFHGHPKASDQPLHVAVARMLGYRWPRQTGSSFFNCSAIEPDGLEKLADEDGIVCLATTKGEAPAAERLRALLFQALGNFDLRAVIAGAGPKGSKSETLEQWLRDEFFEQHCALFSHRPFIWQIWDGLRSGFSVLVNYHHLTHANLEKLTYAYLGDWIRRQQAAVEAGEAGSDARLQAANQLQYRLKLILEGEPPCDIFVRWKPLSKLSVGWQPDLNDGVRLNIRPFLAQDMPGGKKGAGVLRARPNIKWEKDLGKEPAREKTEFPWLWGWDEKQQDFAGVGNEPDGNRWNDCHYTNEFKKRALEAHKRQ